MPELILSYKPGLEWGGLQWNLLNLAFNHQSNGRSDTISRSWNRLIASVGVEQGDLGVLARLWWRIPESSDSDDNPTISDYYGWGDVSAIYKWRGQSFSATDPRQPEHRQGRRPAGLDKRAAARPAARLRQAVQRLRRVADRLQLEPDHLRRRRDAERLAVGGHTMLHPHAKFLLDLMIERSVPPTHTLSPADARSLLSRAPRGDAARPAADRRSARPAGRRPARRRSRCACTTRRPRRSARTRRRCWCTSTAAAGSSATSTRTTRCAASWPTPPAARWWRWTTAWARSTASRPRWTTASPPRAGCATTPPSWASTPRGWRWAATAPAATWPRWWPSRCATPATCRCASSC